MNQDLESILFTVKRYKFCINDFLSAIDYFGVIGDWKSSVQSGMRAVEYANSTGKKLDEEAIAKASEEFRYENDLLNASELKLWLSSNFLDERDLENYLIRHYWSKNITEDFETKDLEVKSYDIYSEIIFSGSFQSLKESWQKRLISWFSEHEEIYENLDELEKHYKIFEQKLEDECELGEWLRVCQKELRYFKIQIVGAEESDYSKARPVGGFDGYYKDMPLSIKKYSDYLGKGEIDGPFADEEVYFWFKLLEEKGVEEQDSEARAYARGQFKDEVWKTLYVKYLDV